MMSLPECLPEKFLRRKNSNVTMLLLVVYSIGLLYILARQHVPFSTVLVDTTLGNIIHLVPAHAWNLAVHLAYVVALERTQLPFWHLCPSFLDIIWSKNTFDLFQKSKAPIVSIVFGMFTKQRGNSFSYRVIE